MIQLEKLKELHYSSKEMGSGAIYDTSREAKGITLQCK